MEHEHELEKEFNCKEKQMLFENDQKAILSPNQQPTELNEFSLESSSSPLPSTSSPSSSMNSRPNTSKRKSKERSIFPLFYNFFFLGFKSSNSRLNSSFPLSCLSRHYYKNNNEKVSSTLQKADSILPIQIDFMNVSYLLFSTFSWESSAYPLLSHYLQDYASYQDEMFSLIDHLTYHTFSSINNVDTTVYRQSIWKFTHRLLGILHNESDFSIICKQLFNTSMEFIQYMIEAPYAITRRDFQNISTKLTNGERCHFIIIVIEAYRQALLLYGIKAINNYLEVYH